MPKPKDSESFDVAGERYRQHEDPVATLGQALADFRTSNPTRNFTHKISGNLVTIYMHCHERGLGDPGRRELQVSAMSKALDEFVKGLKKRFKELGGGTLNLEERKSARGYRLDKVSMNDRWDIISHRTYLVKGLVSFPDGD